MIAKEKQTLMFARAVEWEKSGRTMRDFASDIGISKSCLDYRIRKKRSFAGNSLQFVELIPSIGNKGEMQQSLNINEHITRAQIVFTFPGGLCVYAYG